MTKISKLHTGTSCEDYRMSLSCVKSSLRSRLQSTIWPRQNVSPVLEAKLELPKIKILPSPKAILGVQRILFEIFFRISASKIRRSSLLSAFLKLLRLRDGAIHVDTSILVPQTVVNVNGPKLVKTPQE